jgi:hypothetical protein
VEKIDVGAGPTQFMASVFMGEGCGEERTRFGLCTSKLGDQGVGRTMVLVRMQEPLLPCQSMEIDDAISFSPEICSGKLSGAGLM